MVEDNEWVIYDISPVLVVPTTTTFVYFSGHLINIRRDHHQLTEGVNYPAERHMTISQDIRTMGAAEHLYMACGRFFVTALYGAAYGFNDSGYFCDWDRFVGTLTPVTPTMRDFVEFHDYPALLRGTRIPHDLSLIHISEPTRPY